MLLRVTFEVGGIRKAVFNFIFSSFLAMVSVEAVGLKFDTTISFVSLKFKEIIIALSCRCYCDMYIQLSKKKKRMRLQLHKFKDLWMVAFGLARSCGMIKNL